MEALTTESVELYSHISSPGIPITIEVSPLPVDDAIPGEENIVEAMMQIRLHHTIRPLGMKAEQLHTWHRTLTC